MWKKGSRKFTMEWKKKRINVNKVKMSLMNKSLIFWINNEIKNKIQ